ncbi:Glucosyltransferase-like protein [Tieghemiomyces parasiticus]|uniref:Alpha-1,3-glucosyltransferase n=1 Tax=Tieghemiomyces parasiticus TaxID=78921 RepID=A0A9W8DJE5_9FUNG|nr:Glucosyltransferase-like protein [Tieghemiomyces parasiticus]
MPKRPPTPSKKAAAASLAEALPASSPAERWFSYLRTTFGPANGLYRLAPVLTLILALYVRFAVGLGSYSGEGVNPTYGDYEAQRHWMELTYHLPVDQWYTYSPDYWRLDYPPLSAYVSWVCGAVAHWLDPAWVALESSRGIETPDSKVFMRTTVVVAELLVYIPAVYLFLRGRPRGGTTTPVSTSRSGSDWVRNQTLWLLVLLQPALILIDHGHFQYNAVMLGCVVWMLVAFQHRRYLLGAVSFCLALAFKQMALYFAPAVFAYLLGICFQSPRGPRLFIQLGITVVATFALCFLPFLTAPDHLRQVFTRIFPVARGLYEDKVANVWCASNVVLKLRHVWELEALVKLSATATLAALLPACYDVFRRPQITRLLYALAVSALAFFLLAFQVHEKSILIPSLPITLLMDRERTLSFLFVNVAVFSMFTLLERDGIVLAYAVVTLFWNWLGGFPFNVRNPYLKLGTWAFFAVVAVIHLMDALVQPPARYPHIYIVINVIFSCGMFCLFYLYLNYRQFHLPAFATPASKTKLVSKKA